MAAKLASKPLIGGLLIAAAALVAFGVTHDRPTAAEDAEARRITHPAIAFPAELNGDRAEAVYRAIKGQIRQNYALSGDPVVLAYQEWKRFNRFPYRSPNHGQRFVNHYANAKARSYGRFEGMKSLPAGSIVVKDSFVVTEGGQLRTGPLFLMEKMGPGFKSTAGTWRFMMLRPDGTVVGMTGGKGAKNVEFCAECHKAAGPEQEYLYFMPDEFRIPASNSQNAHREGPAN